MCVFCVLCVLCSLCVCFVCVCVCVVFSVVFGVFFGFFGVFSFLLPFFPLFVLFSFLGLDGRTLGFWEYWTGVESSGHYGWDGQQQEIPLTTTNKIPPRNVDHVSQQYYDDYSMPSIFIFFHFPYLVYLYFQSYAGQI